MQQEQYDEALAKFEQANQIAPGNPTVHNMIGIANLRLAKFDEALTSFNMALDLNPSFTDARNNRGSTYLALGQLRLAEVDFLAVLGDSTYPHRYQVFFNLGMAYRQQGRLGAAEENFRRAVTAPFPVFQAFIQLAQVYLDQGRPEEAVSLLEDATLRFPERPEVSFELGRTLMSLGRTREAQPYLEEVIAKEPGSDRARMAAAMLNSV
jgi:Tfp pilus assembly protein PilF